MLTIRTVEPSIAILVQENGGYCPCAIEKTEDTKCICKAFREQEEPGLCHCGRYEKFWEDDE